MDEYGGIMVLSEPQRMLGVANFLFVIGFSRIDQPTARLENRSITTARYDHPSLRLDVRDVGYRVSSQWHSTFRVNLEAHCGYR